MNSFKMAGFSLIEILVTISIIGIIGLILTTIVNRSFKSNDKTQLFSAIKQNGQLVLNNLEKTIRQSKAIVCIGEAKDIITLQSKDGTYIRFRYDGGNTTTNSSIKQDLPISNSETPNPSDFCNLGLYLPNKDIAITNTDPAFGVSVANLNFFNNAGQKGTDSLTVSFDLKPALKATGDYSQQVGSGQESFQTTIQLR